MKDTRDTIDIILDNLPAWFCISSIFIPFWLILLSISSSIIENVFDIRFELDHSHVFILYIGGMIYSTLLLKHLDSEKESDKKFYKKITVIMFSLSLSVTYFFGEPVKENISSEIPSASYHYSRQYSPNYSYHDTHSSSNYRHSEPTYTPPPSIETEPLFPLNNNEEHNNQRLYEQSNINPEKISPPSSENAFYERWEYVTSDEQGNKYYINKNFGVYSIVTRIEGNVFSASFRKVLKNGGREVEVPAYNINRGMITEKKIVAYEESIIRFRNKTGVKEFSFSTISGYTSENSIIVGYGIDNVGNIFEWQPINDEVYNALYDSAYKKL